MSREGRGEPDQELDVREIDGEPFDDIMATLEDLASDETLRLVNSFEPEPLYGVLEQRGFDYDTEEVESGLWHVEIRHA